MALLQEAVDAAPKFLDLKPGDVVCHLKRRSQYFIRHVGTSRLQCGDSRHDGSPVVEYVDLRAPHDVWHRPFAEFTTDRFEVVEPFAARVDRARKEVDDLVAERRRRLAEWPGTVEAFDAAWEHAELCERVRLARWEVERLLRLWALLEGR